jgi:hypothetical protein
MGVEGGAKRHAGTRRRLLRRHVIGVAHAQAGFDQLDEPHTQRIAMRAVFVAERMRGLERHDDRLRIGRSVGTRHVDVANVRFTKQVLGHVEHRLLRGQLRAAPLPRPVHARRARVPPVVRKGWYACASQRTAQQFDVADVAREAAECVETRCERLDAREVEPSVRRLESDDAAERCRANDRTGCLRTERQRHHPIRHRSRGTARRPAGVWRGFFGFAVGPG